MNEIKLIASKLRSMQPQRHWREGVLLYGFGEYNVPYVEQVFTFGARVRLYYLGTQEVRAEMIDGDRIAYSEEIVLEGQKNDLSASSVARAAEILIEMCSLVVERSWINNRNGTTLQGSLLTMRIDSTDGED